MTLTAAIALLVTLSGCGSTSSPSSNASATRSSPPAAATTAKSSAATGSPGTHATRVSISNYSFSPPNLSVAAGTMVTFTNHDQTPHTATTNVPGFDTGTVKPGASATVKLKTPGTYTYICQFHAYMHATIVVK